MQCDDASFDYESVEVVVVECGWVTKTAKLSWDNLKKDWDNKGESAK